MKVYCNDCIYYEHTNGIFTADLEDAHNRCTYPDNSKLVDTPIERRLMWVKSPYTINKHNNCKWFKKGKPRGDSDYI